MAALALAAGLAFTVAAPVRAEAIWVRGESMEPSTFDPHKASTLAEARVLDELYEGLTVYDDHGRLQPGVARSWDISTDKRTYTFHLRPDALWSNGDPVTAGDFVYALRRLMDPKTAAQYASVLFALSNARAVNAGTMPPEALGASAPDPATLVLSLEHPTASLLTQMTHFTAMPLHRAEIDRYGSAFARAGRMVGNGAFTLDRYVPNDRIVLRKNPMFHAAGSVALAGETIMPMEDAAAGLRRFLAGEIDSFPTVPADEMPFVRARTAAALHVAPMLASYFYDLDCRQAPLIDPRVRQALSMVVDRRFLAATIWGGTMLPSFSFVPPGLPGYGAPAQVGWADKPLYDREDEARRLLASAGFGPGRPLQLTFRFNQSENHKATAVAIADMWKRLDVQTRFIVTDANTHYAFLGSGKPYDMARGGWFADFADAENFLFLASASSGPLNYAHFDDPRFDDLLAQAQAEPDDNRRETLLHQAEALLLAEQPYLVLMSYQSTNLVSPRLHGWFANVMDHHPGRYISKSP